MVVGSDNNIYNLFNTDNISERAKSPEIFCELLFTGEFEDEDDFINKFKQYIA